MANPIFVFVFLSLHFSLNLGTQNIRQKCVLGADGQMLCTPLSLVSPAVRVSASAPCSRDDIKCWCEKAKDYTNDVRRKHGVSGMLKLGTQKQLDNANRYAKTLSGMGYLKHQNLGAATREVGCQRWMGGENLAFNYETGDIAEMCVKQWVGSPAHFDNLIRDWFEEVVVGFHFDRDGRVYCVQTFALQYPQGTFGSPTDTGCNAVGRSLPSPPPTPTSTPKPSLPGSAAPARNPGSALVRGDGALSCRCIRYGKGCRATTAKEAGKGCKAGTQRSKQPLTCKINCCDFCRTDSGAEDCNHRHVKRICGGL